jgi:hypothetical protein
MTSQHHMHLAVRSLLNDHFSRKLLHFTLQTKFTSPAKSAKTATASTGVDGAGCDSKDEVLNAVAAAAAARSLRRFDVNAAGTIDVGGTMSGTAVNHGDSGLSS